MRIQLKYFAMAPFAFALLNCGKTSESSGEVSSENKAKQNMAPKYIADPMFKDANRAVAGMPNGVLTAFHEKLSYLKRLTNPDDLISSENVLRALDKKTLNVKQPYEIVLVAASKLLDGYSEESSVFRNGWLLPIYDQDKAIGSWEMIANISNGKEDGKWHVGVVGGASKARYTEFEKANGYWQSNYQKILIPDVVSLGNRFVGYVEKDKVLENGHYYKDRDHMEANSTPYSWKEVIVQLCMDTEDKRRRIDNGKRLRRVIERKAAQNEM